MTTKPIMLLFIAFLLAAACSADDTSEGATPDAGVDKDATIEDSDSNGEDGADTPDDGEPEEVSAADSEDGGDAPLCPWKADKIKADGQMPSMGPAARGVDALEKAAYETLRDAALSEAGVHFVATWLSEKEHYIVSSGDGDERKEVAFTRIFDGDGGVHYEVQSGNLKDIFPQTSAQVHGSYADMLAAFENPNKLQLPEHGYIKDDERVGFLSADQQSYPWPLSRIASVFDAPDAPDMITGLRPWAYPFPSTHGGLGVLQSRSTLIVSGKGARKGVIEDSLAMLTDVAPTVLAALGAPTSSGVGPDGKYSDGLYLKRQDGRVLWEALDLEGCQVPKHVIVILYDGLMAMEINHLAIDANPPIDLPTFRALAQDGVVYRYGAVTNFPSTSAPGHITVGTGLWNGRHGVLSNAFFRRETQEEINPFAMLSDLSGLLEDPTMLLDYYDKMVASGTENLAQAAHRAMGKWDPETGEGAFVAVINEVTVKDADWTTIDFIQGVPPGNPMASVAEYAAMDTLAVAQVKALLGDAAAPVPTILQMAFLTTDGVGEATGPHSNELRDTLIEMDGRLQVILDEYAARGALKDTLIILTSDHGMELQDETRSTDLSAPIDDSGVRVKAPSAGLIYLRTLEITKSVTADDTVLTVKVMNHDNNDPVAAATVECEGCIESEVTADDDGVAVFALPDDATSLTVTATHQEFNPQVLQFTL
jgi:hypothetical protein